MPHHLNTSTRSWIANNSIFQRSVLLFMVLFMSAGLLVAQGDKAAKLNQAEQLFNEGVRLQSQRSKASLEQALEKLEQARRLFHSIKNPSREATTLIVTGDVYRLLGDSGKALAAYTQVLALHLTGDLRISQASALERIARIHHDRDERETALRRYQEASSIYRDIGVFDLEAATQIEIGRIYEESGEKQKALDILKEALAGLDRDDRRKRMLGVYTLAKIYDDLGEKQTAIENLREALSISQSTNNRRYEGAIELAFGKIYLNLGNEEMAGVHYSRALEISKKIVDRQIEAYALLGTGRAQDEKGIPQQALESYAQALPAFQAIDDRLGEAYTYNNIGAIYGSQGKNSNALENYEKAHSLLRQIAHLPGQALALSNIGRVYNDLHEPEKALDNLKKALDLYRALSDREGEAAVLFSLALNDEVQGKLPEATQKVETAISIVESLRTKIANQELRSSYFATVQAYYRFGIALLMRLHQQSPNAGYDRKAFDVNESARARALLETLAESRADIRQGVDPKLVEQERALQHQLNAKAFELAQLNAAPSAKAQAKVVAEEVQALTVELQQVKTEIRQTSPRYAALTQPQPLTLKEIQNLVLDRDTLLLEYSLGTDRSYLWAVTSDSMSSYELPKRAEIHAAVYVLLELLNARNKRVDGETKAQWQTRVTREDGKIPAAAASLSRMTLSPIASQLGQKRLVIVADGGLQFIPFAALPTPEAHSGSEGQTSHKRNMDAGFYRGAKPLVVDHEIVSLDSASTLAVIRREVSGRQLAPKAVVALADPVFMANDVRVSAKPGAQRSNTMSSELPNGGVKDLELVEALENVGVTSGGLQVSRLLGTRKEAEDILAMVPASDRMLALDFAASRQTATSAELSRYRYVHFSTHGVLNTQNPDLSGLVFSLVDENGKAQDGFLRAHEVFNLKLPAEVVVLSACQTGIGKEVKGEGLVSLTRGFMYAGAPRVVVSLWSVSELGTTELMVRFYRGMLKEGLRPAAALRAAQLSLMKEGQWSSPFYWAPFTLQGEWR
jgi:CHAT domain-containing protein/predicted negative regulator of RcsB-dependent stress response